MKNTQIIINIMHVSNVLYNLIWGKKCSIFSMIFYLIKGNTLQNSLRSTSLEYNVQDKNKLVKYIYY